MHMHGFPGARNRGGDGILPGESPQTGKFGRMLPMLEPFFASKDAIAALAKTMVEVPGSVESQDNPELPAGYTFLGQFIDHDITFDPTTLKEVVADPAALENYRTPALDLDHLYGRGPAVDPHYYIGQPGRESFFPGVTAGCLDPTLEGGQPFDLPRITGNSYAVIPDPRNDENLAVAQLHCLMQRFHNAVVMALESGKIGWEFSRGKTIFEQARDIVIHHYHWIVLHDFLPRIVDSCILRNVLSSGSSIFSQRGVFMPIEFSAAAFRFGHSLVRQSYELNPFYCDPKLFLLQSMFVHAGGGGPGASVPVPTKCIVDWRRFFRIEQDIPVCPSRRIDPYLAPDLGKLQLPSGEASLPLLNLERAVRLGLPSGQSVARYFGYRPLSPDAIAAGVGDGPAAKEHDLHKDSPLWYYILKEAQVQCGGIRLGQVGSRIVAETIVGLLEHDATSFLCRNRRWTPTLPARRKGTFTMADLIAFASSQSGGKVFPF